MGEEKAEDGMTWESLAVEIGSFVVAWTRSRVMAKHELEFSLILIPFLPFD